MNATTYRNQGQALAAARKQHDVRLATTINHWFAAAIASEPPTDQVVARRSFDDGYREELK